MLPSATLMLAPVAGGEVEALAVPIHVPFAIATESLPRARIALVTVRDAEGRTGLGECAPFPSLTGDTVESARTVAEQLLRAVAGMTPIAALAALEPMRAEVFAQARTGFVGVETALWDLHARQLGVPLALLWGLGAVGAVETDVTLPMLPVADVPAFWQRFGPLGFRTVKVKVGGDVDEDIGRVRALMACAKGLRFTLDGNQGYRVDKARELLRGLAKLELVPDLFEQPLPADDWSGHRELTATSAVPVCLDESVTCAWDAVRVARDRTAAAVNLKIMKAGISETLRIAHVARAAGLKLMIGGMLESEVAMGTSLQLAAAIGGVDFVDLDTPFFFTERVTKASPWHTPRATLECPMGTGHGIERG